MERGRRPGTVDWGGSFFLVRSQSGLFCGGENPSQADAKKRAISLHPPSPFIALASPLSPPHPSKRPRDLCCRESPIRLSFFSRRGFAGDPMNIIFSCAKSSCLVCTDEKPLVNSKAKRREKTKPQGKGRDREDDSLSASPILLFFRLLQKKRA